MVDSLRTLARNRWFNWAWRFIITLMIVGWIFLRIDFAQFARVVVAPQWIELIGMVGAGLVFAFMGGVKVWVLLRALAPIRLQTVVKYFFVSTSLGAFTPAALGDFSIAAFLRREKVPVHFGLSVMLIDRVISIAVYVLVFTPLTLALLLHTDQLWWLPASFFVIAMAGLLLNTLKPARQFVLARFIRVYFPAGEDFARTLSDLVRLYPLHLAGNVALTLGRAIFAGIVVQFALWAAHEQPSLSQVICATNFLSLVNVLPISLGGVGVYEGSGVLLFEQLGMDGEKVLAALFYQRAYIWFSSALILAAYWFYSLGRSRRAVERRF